jgi:hypothetical protein
MPIRPTNEGTMRKLMLLIGVVLSGCLPAFPGLLQVSAKDDRGTPIESADIVAVNVQTKFQVKKATNKFGIAHMGWVPGGVYKVTATYGGRTVPVKDLNVTAAPVQIEFKALAVGAGAVSQADVAK